MATPAPAGTGYSQASFYSSLGSSCCPCRGSGRSSSPLLRRVLAYPALRTAVISGPTAPLDVPVAAGPQPPSPLLSRSSWRGDGDEGRRAPTLPCSRWMRLHLASALLCSRRRGSIRMDGELPSPTSTPARELALHPSLGHLAQQGAGPREQAAMLVP